MNKRLATVLCIGLLGAASGASAQDDWDWSVTPYLWATGIQGDIGLGPVERPVDVSFGDLLDVLTGALLGHFEGEREDDGVFGDFIWMSVEPHDEIATVGGTASAELETTIMEFGYYRKLENWSIAMGLRYWDFEIELVPALASAVERDDSWTDFTVGIRQESPIAEKWQLATNFNIGAGGSDLTYGVDLLFSRTFDSGHALVAGFKALGVDYYNDSVNGIPFKLDTIFTGATIGYRFD